MFNISQSYALLQKNEEIFLRLRYQSNLDSDRSWTDLSLTVFLLKYRKKCASQLISDRAMNPLIGEA